MAVGVDFSMGTSSSSLTTQRLRQQSALATRRRAHPQLSRTGPSQPVGNLCLLLGPASMPVSFTQRFKLRSLGIIGVAVLYLWLVLAPHNWRGVGTLVSFMALWFAGLISLCIALVVAGQLHQRWKPGTPERPLMALTPSLSPPPSTRRHLLVATLRTPCATIALIAIAQVMAALLAGNTRVLVAGVITRRPSRWLCWPL